MSKQNQAAPQADHHSQSKRDPITNPQGGKMTSKYINDSDWKIGA